MRVVYNKIQKITDPLIFVENRHNVKLGESVTINCPDNTTRNGKVISLNDKAICIQVFQGTQELNITECKMIFHSKMLKIGISDDMIGKIFDGFGRLRNLHGTYKEFEVIPDIYKEISYSVLNPFGRINPTDFIQTGISAIDGLNSLVRGQKLPIFTGQGLPHNELVGQIITQSKLPDDEPFLIIFCGIGILLDDAIYFKQKLEQSGNFQNVIFFANLASDPVIERILIPRIALTTAEYFGFVKEMNVLVVMSDMTNYCESLRVLSNSKEELPGRKGFPGYLYSDLASIYERAGKIKNNKGSITQIPVLSMPDDDITHPIPDLTGYITEGQIVLSRNMDKKDVYPPINILSSLSRLMKSGVGNGKTREDHQDLANQLYAFYAKGIEIEKLATIIGKESLSETDTAILKFKDIFENYFINQGSSVNRSIEQTLDLGWKILSLIPIEEITRIHKDMVDKYYCENLNKSLEDYLLNVN